MDKEPWIDNLRYAMRVQRIDSITDALAEIEAMERACRPSQHLKKVQPKIVLAATDDPQTLEVNATPRAASTAIAKPGDSEWILKLLEKMDALSSCMSRYMAQGKSAQPLTLARVRVESPATLAGDVVTMGTRNGNAKHLPRTAARRAICSGFAEEIP